jgi:hypothetical protein
MKWVKRTTAFELRIEFTIYSMLYLAIAMKQMAYTLVVIAILASSSEELGGGITTLNRHFDSLISFDFR